MFKSILPKEYAFFDLFEKHISLCIEQSKELVKLATGKEEDFIEHVRRINQYERQMDDVTRECIEALHRTFITPIERTDIHALITKMDDIGDYIEGAVNRMELYELRVMRPEIKELGEVLVKATGEIQVALSGFRDMKNIEMINNRCIEIHKLESEGDAILRNALMRLFKEQDAILVIKWKEIYERLEKAIDRCEAVANIIEGVVIESA